MAGSSQGTSSTGGSDVGLAAVGGGRSVDPNDQGTFLPIFRQPLVPVDVPATASMEMGDRSLEWGSDSAHAAEYPVLYDIGVPPRPEVTPRDPKFDPTYYYTAQSAQMPPVIVDIAATLPVPTSGQPLGSGGVASPDEAMMLASLQGIVGV